jgi:5-methylcytosine-specific restriction protein A
MPTYILTWNPDNWEWPDLAEAAEATSSGQIHQTRWSTGNTKRIQPGDRLFLLKQGRPPKGIIGSGLAMSECYLFPHWDKERAKQGDEAIRVDVDFDRILDPDLYSPLSTDQFSADLANVYWAMPASGMQLSEQAADQLESEWEKHLQTLRTGASEREGSTRVQRNPAWQRDELILALDLYFRFPPSNIGKNHPEVVALSELLNALPIHAQRPDASTFRNPNGVYMKMCNFLRFDPNYQGKGLERGNRLEQEVWDTFAGNHSSLTQVANAIRNGFKLSEATTIVTDADVDEEETFPEGKVLFRLHRSRERNRKLITRAKALALTRHGQLFCCVCQFDFKARYGDIGEGFIECHHTKPISELDVQAVTKVNDLALVCSNCHRMIHRKRPWLTLDQLTQLVK